MIPVKRLFTRQPQAVPQRVMIGIGSSAQLNSTYMYVVRLDLVSHGGSRSSADILNYYISHCKTMLHGPSQARAC